MRLLSLFKRLFRKKTPSYETRSFVGTPRGFRETRSPSDVLTVSHPSPTEYQAHLDFVYHKTRREQALSYLSENPVSDDYASEDLFENESEDMSDDSTPSSTTFLSKEKEEYPTPEQRCSQIPAVNQETAQKQWKRLQLHAPHNQMSARLPPPASSFYLRNAPPPQPNYRTPVCQDTDQLYSKTYRETPAPTYSTSEYRQIETTQSLQERRPARQRISFLPPRLQHRRGDPFYRAAPAYSKSRKHYHSAPNTRQPNINSAALQAARVACERQLSHHKGQFDSTRKRNRLPRFPDRKAGGVIIPGAWVD